MDVVFLGTNGWYDSATGNTICILIKSHDYYIILDAGNGIHKLDQHYQKAGPVFILLSHFHLDHIAGLHILAKFAFAEGLVIAGPKGTREILNHIISMAAFKSAGGRQNSKGGRRPTTRFGTF